MARISLQPFRLADKIKLRIWRHAIYPAFPHVRDGLLSLGIIRHSGRQPWPIGWIAPGKTAEDLVKHLEKLGFHNHFVAWVDSDQSFGLRLHDGFSYQYHLRIFNDGEVRGHYEKTPESNPVDHFMEKGFEPRTEDFDRWLQGWVINVKSQSMPATSRGLPKSG